MDKEWFQQLGKYGFAGLVAGFLLYVFVYDVRAAQALLREEHRAMRQSVDAVVNISGQSDMAQQQILFVLQTMCVNAARSDDQRDRCLSRIDTRTR